MVAQDTGEKTTSEGKSEGNEPDFYVSGEPRARGKSGKIRKRAKKKSYAENKTKNGLASPLLEIFQLSIRKSSHRC